MVKGDEDRTDTKQLILDTALELFSINGYQAVSIRTISGAIGMKESAIYYHFKNKQDIFDHLLQQVQVRMDHMQRMFDDRFDTVNEIWPDEFALVAIGIVQGYLMHEPINKMLRMLTIEQFRSREAAELYNRLMFEQPWNQCRKTFARMIERGFFIEADPGRLASEYYGMICFLYQRNLGNAESNAEDRAQRMQNVQQELSGFAHTFFARYQTGGSIL
ncbi:TetR/AcrR family transcriptional regulator [Gorillibacterium timonense]|uniref:TetR/AcrR family transcriptional regulator n=1 Tax=Gorillibacterium timonense TaxID=1689269 RepID=UPI00071D43D2|nr:TetR/AcrR family transcriptional regulator [Gorillibacterium timonense]